MKKPKKLVKGDTVALLSPSWAGPSVYPKVFDLGKRNLINTFGLKVREYPSTRATQKFNQEHPELRARDINSAFADKSVKAIISSIGGDDCIRLLPFLDKKVLRSNPKIFMGYSDTTAILFFLNQIGLVAFHGPSVMSGFGGDNLVEFKEHIFEILFENHKIFQYIPYSQWTDQFLNWNNPKPGKSKRKLKKNNGWKFVQGKTKVRGELVGGCIEVLEFFKGTQYWPPKSFWDNKILLFETSEEHPTPEQVVRFLRNYGMQGILGRISALVFGRPTGYSSKENEILREKVLSLVNKEFGLKNLPIVMDFDFGHTEPQLILPLGLKAEVDPRKKSFRLIESVFVN